MKNLSAFLFAAALTLAPTQAFAFGTVRTLGQHAEHEQITRAALSEFQPQTLNEIAGRNLRFGAVGAPDNPLRGLMSTPEAHCDGGDYLTLEGGAPYAQTQEQARANLGACRAFIVNALEAAVREAAPLAVRSPAVLGRECEFNGQSGDVKCRVLEHLGIAFHAAQDFYSHSNWVDRPAPGAITTDNPPGLGQSGRAPWLDPRDPAPAFPAGLISGCYEGLPERLHCAYTDRDLARVRHMALNKDNGIIARGEGTTPRGRVDDNFARAVGAAIDDTRDKWAYVQDRIRTEYGVEDGARIICVITRDDTRSC